MSIVVLVMLRTMRLTFCTTTYTRRTPCAIGYVADFMGGGLCCCGKDGLSQRGPEPCLLVLLEILVRRNNIARAYGFRACRRKPGAPPEDVEPPSET